MGINSMFAVDRKNTQTTSESYIEKINIAELQAPTAVWDSSFTHIEGRFDEEIVKLLLPIAS